MYQIEVVFQTIKVDDRMLQYSNIDYLYYLNVIDLNSNSELIAIAYFSLIRNYECNGIRMSLSVANQLHFNLDFLK